VFGTISFSLALTSFALTFIAQISMVLFPALRQKQYEEQEEIYHKIRKILHFVLPVIYLLYVPMKWILSEWLPQYKVSIDYLALLLPICIYDSETNLLFNTYFKVWRLEKKLLLINVTTMCLSTVLSIISCYIFKSHIPIVLVMTLATFFRSIYSESLLRNRLNSSGFNMGYVIKEVVVTVIFMFAAWWLQPGKSFMIVLAAYVFVILLSEMNRKKCDTVI
ncbi:MAG: hypothetical protein J6J42_10995, partial [Lachnospiraceae bacterium]|nr:hypothetical protein [Lachnospiraceae bacterium]